MFDTAKLVCFVFMLLAVLTGCSQQSAPKHIGILLHGESRVPLRNGFLEEMKTLGFEVGKNLLVTELNSNNDPKQLKPLTEQLLAQPLDLLVAAGGLEAEEIKVQLEKTKAKTPVLVLYINAIIERKFVADRRNPGWNVTGIDNLNAELSSKRIELMYDLIPALKRVLILYNPKIEPSAIGLQHARDEAGKRGIQIVERAVTKPDEIKQAMEALQPGEVDAMLLVPTAPIDNELKNVILPNADRLKIPVMAHSRTMLQAGALASYGAPFTELGRQGARLAQKILGGTPASNNPFEVPTKYEYSVNQSALKKLGFELPALVRSQLTEIIE